MASSLVNLYTELLFSNPPEYIDKRNDPRLIYDAAIKAIDSRVLPW